jgi:hypothetical protein
MGEAAAMPDSTIETKTDASGPSPGVDRGLMGSDEYFEAERREERRKRWASWSMWFGLIGILLLLIPNPVPWLAGPVAILLGVVALIRIRLAPQRHGGARRAVLGIILGLVSVLACRWWLA